MAKDLTKLIVGEIKIIRITNNKNGLFKELDYNKYSHQEVTKMIEFYQYIDFSLNIYNKFIKEVTND